MKISNTIKIFAPRTVNRRITVSLVLVALVPVCILGFKIYQVAWDNAWREITEKHQLLAENLASPISIYISNNKKIVQMLGNYIEENQLNKLVNGVKWENNRNEYFDQTHLLMGNFRSLSLIDKEGELIYCTDNRYHNTQNVDFTKSKSFTQTVATGKPYTSGIEPSIFNKNPTILITQPILDLSGKISQVIIAELNIDTIEKLRKGIKFGKKGHSAIVDQFGTVVAHPNPEWMTIMKSLAHLNVVKNMLNEKTGVIEFYSPFLKENMVAGYTSVPGIKWGIMVPQPKSEVEEHVNNILHTHLWWAMFGICLAIGLGLFLTRWINTPLRKLQSSAIQMVENNGVGRLPALPSSSPQEIRVLRDALNNLLDNLQHSRKEFEDLSHSLKQKVKDATTELRDANIRLNHLASIDHLTQLANRRTFEANLEKSYLSKRDTDNFISILLIDVDNFKYINDTWGHAAGDAVLISLANIFNEHTRQEDLAARYAGDEFVIKMSCNQEISKERAIEIIDKIHAHNFTWKNQSIEVTISIGLICVKPEETTPISMILQKADEALYKAKMEGRDKLVQLVI